MQDTEQKKCYLHHKIYIYEEIICENIRKAAQTVLQPQNGQDRHDKINTNSISLNISLKPSIWMDSANSHIKLPFYVTYDVYLIVIHDMKIVKCLSLGIFVPTKVGGWRL